MSSSSTRLPPSHIIPITIDSASQYYDTATDGGRVALALFGRNAKMSIGLLALGALFLVGLLGSDLFLFYFAFVISFQSGNEIPARNEVDNVGFSRVLVATAVYVLGMLTLIPFQ